jgi:hypothetical protein
VTIPDGSIVNPYTFFTKIWRLRNTGSCTWDSGYQIVFVDGTQMSESKFFKWTGGIVGYGQTADITVNLISPRTPGTYQGNFMLLAPNGTYFGLGTENKFFWVKIVVPEPNKPPPAPSIVSPLKDDRFCQGAISLKWNASSDPSGIAAYKIQVWRYDSQNPLLELVVSSSSTNHTTPEYNDLGAYAWAVSAQDGEGAWGASSGQTPFYIDSCPG